FPGGLHENVRKADVRAAAGLVAGVAKAAGRPTRALDDREERIVARLRSAADPRSLARRGLLRAAHGLDAAIGPLAQRRAAHEGVASLAGAVAALDAPLAAARRHSAAPALTGGDRVDPSGDGVDPSGEGVDPSGDPLEILAEVPEVLGDPPP